MAAAATLWARFPSGGIAAKSRLSIAGPDSDGESLIEATSMPWWRWRCKAGGTAFLAHMFPRGDGGGGNGGGGD